MPININLWTPAALTTALWLDAADAATITLNGSNVSRWNDKSGNGRNVAQGTAVKQPAYTTAAQNGLNVLTFNSASSQSLFASTAVINLPQPFSRFIAAQFTTKGNESVLIDSEVANNQCVFYNGENGSTNWTMANGVGPGSFASFAYGTRDFLNHQHFHVLNGASSTWGLDGSTPATVTNSPGATGQTGIRIGNVRAEIAGKYAFNGRVFEIIEVSGIISTSDRQKIEGYLAWKWGLVSNLPSNHPYKAFPPVLSIFLNDAIEQKFFHTTTDLFWDANGGNGANDSTSNQDWNTASRWWNGTSAQTWANNSNAIIGAGGGSGSRTISLATSIYIAGLTLRPSNVTTYTLGTADQTIYLRNGINKLTGTNAYTIASPIVMMGAQTWSNSGISTALTLNGAVNNGGYMLTISGAGSTTFGNVLYSGAGGLTKNDTGTLSFLYGAGGNPTYGGPLILNGGVLRLGGAGSDSNLSGLPSGNITVNGGVFDVYWANIFTRSLGAETNNIQIIGGASGFSQVVSGQTLNIKLNNSDTPIVWGSAFFNPSALVLNTSSALGIVNFQNYINLNGADRTIRVNASTGVLSGVISNSSGTAGIIKTGSGTLSFSGVTNTYNGGTTINGGTLDGVGSTTVGAGTITITGNSNITPVRTDSGIPRLLSGGLIVNSGVTLTINNATQYYDIGFNGVASGSGTILFGGNNNGQDGYSLGLFNTANTFTGTIACVGFGTTSPVLLVNSFADSANPINMFGSTFTLHTGAIAPLVFNSRVITFSGTTAGGTINNNNATAANTITINTNLAITATGAKTLELGGSNTGNNTFAGVIADGASAVISLLKSGAGTWILSGINTYTGTTTINGSGGILRIIGSIGSGAVTVTSGTLAGPSTSGASATIAGGIAVNNATTAILLPGSFGNNVLNTGSLTFGGTSSRLTIDSTTTTFSSLNVTGDVALGGCGLIFNSGISSNGTYNLIVASGTMSGTLPVIATNSTGKTLTIQQVGNTLQVVVS